jgi:hypothetical protein
MAFRIGVALMVGSLLPWLTMPAVPFLPLTVAEQGVVVGALVGLAELIFWPGVALAGKGAWEAAKAQGWRRMPVVMWQMLLTGRVPVEGPPPAA